MNQPWIYMYSPSRSPPPTSLSTRSLWVFPVHQARALVSCIQPGLVICFTIDNIHAVLSKHPTLAFSHRVQKSVLYICVSFSILHIGLKKLDGCCYPLSHAVLCAVLSRSVVSGSLRPHGQQPTRLLCPWGFSRQEHWSGLPGPPLRDLPNPGIKLRSHTLQADSLPSERPGKP